MKKLTILSIALTLFINAFSQDKKPLPYSFGLGYGINFVSNSGSNPIQSLNLSVWMPKNFEIVFPLSFNYTGIKNELNDSTRRATKSGTRYVDKYEINEMKTFTFSMSPGFNYHIPLKTNLDIYVGMSIPISIAAPLQNKLTDEYTSINYVSKISTSSKYKPTINASGLLTFGCNYFFYQNLALGAKASISINIINSAGSEVTTITTIENSGSDNPTQGYSSVTTTNKPRTKFTSQNIGFNGGGGFYLAYYFGMKGDKNSVKE